MRETYKSTARNAQIAASLLQACWLAVIKPTSGCVRKSQDEFWQVHSQKRTNCSKSAAGLLACSHQANVRMRSHHLFRLEDNKSVCQKKSTRVSKLPSKYDMSSREQRSTCTCNCGFSGDGWIELQWLEFSLMQVVSTILRGKKLDAT